MNIEKIIDKVSNPSTTLVLHAVERKKSQLTSVELKTSQKLRNQIRNIVKKQLQLNKDSSTNDYNIVGANDGVNEVVKREEYNDQIHNIIESLKSPDECKDFEKTRFNFFVYEFRLNDSVNENDKIFIFRRISNFKKLNRGFFGNIENGYFKNIDSHNVLGVDDKIDMLIYRDEVLIFKHIAFERILGLSEQFKTYAEKVLSNDTFEKKILNFQELKEDALGNKNYIKRLAKLKEKDVSTLFLNDLEKTKKVINHFNLDIEVDVEHKQLIYNNKTQLGNFINLMQDSYYRTLIGNQDGVDERR